MKHPTAMALRSSHVYPTTFHKLPDPGNGLIPIRNYAGFGSETSSARADAENHITRRFFGGLLNLRNTCLVVLVLICILAYFLGSQWVHWTPKSHY